MRKFLRHSMMNLLTSFSSQAVPTALMYHSVRDASDPFFTVPPQIFEDQIKLMLNSGCKWLSISDIVSSFTERSRLPDNGVCITFDDGYKDNLIHALPILEKYNVPAAVYVTTGYVTGELPARVPVCNVEEIQLLAQSPLITIGAHTHSHARLGLLDDNQALGEIYKSKRMLESWLQMPVLHFAYPKGDFNYRTSSLLESAGFISSVTTIPRHLNLPQDKWHIGRMSVDQSVESAQFLSLLKAGATIYHQCRRAWM